MSAKNLSDDEAEALARDALGSLLGPRFDAFDIKRTSHSFGWVFHWAPASGPLLCGNAPLIVDRKDGSVRFAGTRLPLDVYLEAYARFGATGFDERLWENAIDAQRERQWRAHTDARRDGRTDLGTAPDLTIDWDEVSRVLVDGPTKEAAVREPNRCYYCDVYLPPRRAAQTAAGLACSACASKQ